MKTVILSDGDEWYPVAAFEEVKSFEWNKKYIFEITDKEFSEWTDVIDSFDDLQRKIRELLKQRETPRKP